MAKKKKSQRKRNFAYSGGSKNRPIVATKEQPADPLRIEEPAQEAPAAAVKSFKRSVPQETTMPKMGFLKQDLKMIAILAFGAVALELVLWVILRHTGLGSSIFSS